MSCRIGCIQSCRCLTSRRTLYCKCMMSPIALDLPAARYRCSISCWLLRSRLRTVAHILDYDWWSTLAAFAYEGVIVVTIIASAQLTAGNEEPLCISDTAKAIRLELAACQAWIRTSWINCYLYLHRWLIRSRSSHHCMCTKLQRVSGLPCSSGSQGRRYMWRIQNSNLLSCMTVLEQELFTFSK
jgi:hypothetical protein